MKHEKIGAYRRDIDGLRAIAVLAVIAFHAYPSSAPGGFVGVDIFFVISGYLISRLIYMEMEMGSFSLMKFYTRRIKRLLPVYILVSLSTLVVSSYLLIPNDYIFYTTSLAASWAFLSNVFFSMLSWGYFGQRSEGFPLLHTWSLSVEEQFYFIFPLLLLSLFRYARQAMLPIFVLAGLFFVGLSEWGTSRVGAYFLLPYRAHELIIGVLTFFAIRAALPKTRALANLLGALGVVLIFGSIFILDRSVPFPGVRSLLPCVGAALLIYAGSRDNLISPLLSGKWMVSIGLISYSLYLWHWPIFAFLNYRKVELTLPVAAVAVLLALVLSILSWKFVEQPIRRSREIGFGKALLRFYVAPAALFLAVGIASYGTEGAPQRFSADLRQLISSYSFERDLTRSCSIRANDRYELSLAYLEKHCAFGDISKSSPKILLIGDSHAHHFKPFVDSLAKRAHLKSVYHVQGSCDAIELLDSPGAEPSSCEQRNQILFNMADRFDYVVLASAWSYKGNEKVFEKKLRLAIQKIIAAKSVPIVFKDNPSTNEDLSQCILFLRRGWGSMENSCHLAIADVDNKHASLNAVIDSLKLEFPQVVVINPTEVMCDATSCPTYIGNVALYKDSNHLNTTAAILLAERYLALRGNPFMAADLVTSKIDHTKGNRENIQ